MSKKFLLLSLLILSALLFGSWGFFAHQKINRLAVFTLPSGMIKFYKAHIDFITEHAVDPDKRRYADPEEAARHFLDADHYGKAPFDSIPQKWNDAVAKFSEDSVKAHGTVPWQIQKTYYSLVKAFQEKDSLRILRYSADLGHYISDAHVPLHTTQNYNGQLSNQHGIHAFWESELPEQFFNDYDFFVGRARYIENPLKEAWRIVKTSFSYKDSVLLIEARLNRSFPSDKKYAFRDRNGKIVKQHSLAYSQAYHKALKGLVEQQMRASVLSVGSYWYSAWVDAGQPELKNLRNLPTSAADKEHLEKEEKLFLEGKPLGRPEH
ncbi:zinc dependent phospholipase C family protein [Pedobacter sp. SYSU D00535]|uniref:zinc dependent phospholipase C family protein n=1 Tax=Pedobacter sp. SYSU D00535 TaxID=2810308 RepID=UPI001A95C867|nr:zinc dependent phospholipase C family protein [Pedobacter sp. SYSU D00535]